MNKLFKLILILGLFCGQESQLFAQCCNFKIYPVGSAIDPPSNEDAQACKENKYCDNRFAFAAQMINHFNEGEIDSFYDVFEIMIEGGLIEDRKDSLNLEVIYRYASYLEFLGEDLVASAYYKYVNLHSLEYPLLRILSGLGLASTSGNAKSLEEFKQEFQNVLLGKYNVSDEQKKCSVLRLAYIVPTEEKADLLKPYFQLNDGLIDPNVDYVFLLYLEYYLGRLQDPMHGKVVEEMERIFPKTTNGKFDSTRYASKFVEELNAGNYDKALFFARKEVESVYGSFDSNEQLIKRSKELSRRNSTEILRYAKAKLFQTRLGRGVEPVKEAFEIYFSENERQIFKGSGKVSNLASQKKYRYYSEMINILIVGEYLSREDRGGGHLDRSVSLLDYYNDLANIYWIYTRREMRNDSQYEVDKNKVEYLDEELESIEDSTSIRTIHLLENAVRSKREQFREKYGEIFKEGKIDSLIHLPTLQSQQGADSSAVLSYYLSPSVLYRLFVSGDTIMIDPINAVREEALVLAEEFKTLVQGPRSEALANTSHRLFELLFSGLEDLLPERVHIIASGALTDVPFSALRMDAGTDRPRYLGVEHAVSRQFSIRGMQLLEQADLRPTYERPLALAPAFKSEWMLASELRQAGFVLPPLTHNSEELEALEAFGPGRYLYGARATRERYREYAPDHSIIHLATHALSSDLDGLRSRVYLLGEGGEAAPLYASEVGEKTLNADLVVLSACETGGGARHVVEGTIGLTKAYLAAGARAVVASSWAVDDLATARLMEFFYGELAGGARPHDALRSARASFLDANPDVAPQKWAAFEAYGGMKAPRWDKSAPAFGKPWWWAFGLAGLALVLYWLWNGRKRTGVSDAAG